MCYNYHTASPQPGGGMVPLSFSPMVDQMEEEEPHLVQLDSREKQSYTEQAAKRKHCQRLTRYVCIAIVHNSNFIIVCAI